MFKIFAPKKTTTVPAASLAILADQDAYREARFARILQEELEAAEFDLEAEHWERAAQGLI